MDATDKEARVPHSRGRSVVVLYNTRRPHSQLGWLTPEAYAVARWSAALRSTDSSVPRTVAITAQEGISNRPTPVATG